MTTNWKELALKVGSLHHDGSESGGDSYGKAALEEILGEEWMRHTVEHIISFKRGSEIATNCLCLIHSHNTAIYAYGVYKSSEGERANRAVWLIKELAHPVSFDWIEEFLNDQNVMGWGLGVLDQLLWTKQIPYDEKAESLLQLALTNSEGKLTDLVAFIRNYLLARAEGEN
ncbi:hypothetical protein A4D02_03395 [Niastella koreensis]|uniref:Uncharacterized protein n=2 Tax=Niastella koreensis TaxID=354356 RepID=G8TMN2_NIAKG|nr:hypothetical protein [Niastella koreensis]AEW03053.1 hypothetical protein Niako_6831 [Niastella koreensis GR20-10]OQP55368.1 hypothetical protein A4D02_03395 [Niastella koreensis]